MRRSLAVLGAVAMVAAALVVRQAIDDGGEGGDDAGPSATGDVVLCAADLADACRSLPGVDVRVEEAAVTAAAVVEGRLADDVGAWLTTSAWVEVLEERVPTALGAPERVATSPAVAAVTPARVDAVRSLCGDDVWRCLGDRAEQPWAELGGDGRWGALRTGLPAADTATGLAVVGAVVAGYFGGTDFAANDFDAGGLRPWLASLADASRQGDPDPAATLVTRPGTYTAAAVPAAAVSSVDPDRVAVLEVAPVVEVEVVVAPIGERDPLAADDARQALGAQGWEPASGPARPRYKPGVLAALHTLWTEVT